jgi:hypothetical protein
LNIWHSEGLFLLICISDAENSNGVGEGTGLADATLADVPNKATMPLEYIAAAGVGIAAIAVVGKFLLLRRRSGP